MSAVGICLSGLSDEQLAVLAREKNEEAFAMLVTRFSGMLKALSSQYCRGLFDCDDLAQEGLLGLLSAAQTYQASENVTFRTYAYACARNRMVSALRRRKGVELTPLDEEDELSWGNENEDPQILLVRRDEVLQLQRRLQNILTKLEYHVLMAQLCGYSYREIAKQLNVTEKSVDNALFRLRRKLATSF